MSENCTFCKIYAEGKAVVFQTDQFFGQFDRFPDTPGHMEVVPKRHVVDFFELNNAEISDLFFALVRGKEVIEKTDLQALYRRFVDFPLNAKSVEFSTAALQDIDLGRERSGENIGINNGRAAGRTVDHMHVHIIPRYVGDVPDPTGGVRHIIPGKGNYKK